MTQRGLEGILDLASDLTEVLTNILDIYRRVRRISLQDGNMVDAEAYKALNDSMMGLRETHKQGVDVLNNMIQAVDAEKELLNKQDDDNRRDDSSTSRVEG